MKKIKLEQQQKREKRFISLSSLFIAITVLLAFTQLILSNRLATFGRELEQLAKQDRVLSLENELLKKDIAKGRSIATVAQRAKQFSLGPAVGFLSVEEGESVALLHTNTLP